MENILVKPKTKKEYSFIKTVLEYSNVYFESLNKQEIEKSEGDMYYPILDEKIKKALENEKEGKTIKLKETGNANDFWKQIREYEV